MSFILLKGHWQDATNETGNVNRIWRVVAKIWYLSNPIDNPCSLGSERASIIISTSGGCWPAVGKMCVQETWLSGEMHSQWVNNPDLPYLVLLFSWKRLYQFNPIKSNLFSSAGPNWYLVWVRCAVHDFEEPAEPWKIQHYKGTKAAIPQGWLWP